MMYWYTKRATEALGKAQEISRRYFRGFVNTEDVLLSLLEREEIRKILGDETESIRKETELLTQKGENKSSSGRPYSSKCREALGYADREAKNMGLDEIDTPHILLGLSIERYGKARDVLDKFDLRTDELRKAAAEHYH